VERTSSISPSSGVKRKVEDSSTSRRYALARRDTIHEELERRVWVLEKNEKKRQKELDRVTIEHKVLQDVLRDFLDEKDVNIRHDRETAIETSQQWNDTSLEMDPMQCSSATTCREEYRNRTKTSSNGEKLSMLQRVGTVCCVIFVVSR